MFRHILAIFVILAAVAAISAQADAEREAINRTALNYAEGWYEGNADKMEVP
jgi:hypothetical protein